MIAFPAGAASPSHPVAQRLHSLFPRGAYVAFAEPCDPLDPLYPEEERYVRRAVPSRRHEYTLGRMCARRALSGLGISESALPTGADRAPIWPRGVVGSIAHCAGFVGAAVARTDVVSSLGFDVEPATPLDDALVPLICTPSEIAWMERAGLLPDADWPKVLFCAKEAVHKCISPLTGVMLDFTEVSLSVDPSLGGFTVSIERSDPRLAPALQRVAGRLAVGEHFVFTSAVTV